MTGLGLGKSKMQNGDCKVQNSDRDFYFCLLQFAFCIGIP
jgi:hypothetical protein